MDENQSYNKDEAKEILKESFSPIQLEALEDGRLKVDFDTDYENFLSFIIFFGLLINVIYIFMLIFGDISFAELCEAKEYYLIPLITSIVVGYYRFSMNHYYILDPYNQEIYFSRNAFHFSHESFVSSFQDIYCVALQGKRERSKHSKWWEYYGAIILRNGDILRISDAYKIEEQKEDYLDRFKELAKKLNVPFLKINEGNAFKVVNTPVQSMSDLRMVPESDIDRGYLIKSILVVIIIMLCFLFLSYFI